MSGIEIEFAILEEYALQIKLLRGSSNSLKLSRAPYFGFSRLASGQVAAAAPGTTMHSSSVSCVSLIKSLLIISLTDQDDANLRRGSGQP